MKMGAQRAEPQQIAFPSVVADLQARARKRLVDMMKGQRVWYWARRKGERAHIKSGLIVDISPDLKFVRVQIDSHDSMPVQVVAAQRLKFKQPLGRLVGKKKPLDFGIGRL